MEPAFWRAGASLPAAKPSLPAKKLVYGVIVVVVPSAKPLPVVSALVIAVNFSFSCHSGK